MGRVFRSYYTKSGVFGDDGKPKRFYSKSWTIEFTDAYGKTVRRKAGTTERQAKRALAKAETEAMDERHGMGARGMANVPCAQLVEKYLIAQKPHVSAKHHGETKRRLNELLAHTTSGGSVHPSRSKHASSEPAGIRVSGSMPSDRDAP